MSVHSESQDASDGLVLARIRAAAGETLAAWPGARAAVLFGSRARGDHSVLSDWDIAFITAEGERVGAVPDGLPIDRFSREEGLDVQCLALPELVARRKACAIGHVARAIVRDGRLLAGTWDRGMTRGKRLEMEPEEYWRLAYCALNHMENAALEAEKLGKSRSWNDDISACDSFAAATADATKHLAKAMLGRNGIDYDRTHDLARLGELADRAGRPGLGNAIRSMNGKAHIHHSGRYGGVTADDCRHAVARFLAIAPLLADEVAAGERDARLSGRDGRQMRPAAVMKARECQTALREAAGRPAAVAPEELLGGKAVLLAESRLVLAAALAGLEENLDPDASPPTPSPYD
ncbi:MAG: nucleotidyltransferase domain-containing protein [Alphaproteobacteria bacterium]|nr:nucleotidyltransferase domain-containing protein [Alphaproteobacteria bacterium]